MNNLTPEMLVLVDRFREFVNARGLSVLFACGYRHPREQAILYRRSRSLFLIHERAELLKRKWERLDLSRLLLGAPPQYGPLATRWAPGQSLHQYGLAIDAYPLIGGKPLWGTRSAADRRTWEIFGLAGEAAGLEWGGRFCHGREYPHLQMPGIDWKTLIKQ